MTRETALAAGRTMAEAGMMDACIIVRDTVTAVNTQTGAQTVTTVTLYEGVCRYKKSGAASGATVGGAYQLMLGPQIHLPIVTAAEGLRPGDRITITAAVNDPELVGRVMRIHDLPHESESTARTFGVQEVI
jgi:Family of unknown function (DUF6093)